MKMKLHAEMTFKQKVLHSKTSFETEAQENLEMA